ncbi:MAG: PEGA domain-containing protein [Phycisphaerales bacterium]
MVWLPMRANLTLFVLLGALGTGCVRRTIMITSEPPGVLIWVNDREVGRTPIDIDFEYYGVYDVRLELAGYEPMMTSGKASAPWWDKLGADFFAELVPADLHSEVRWHYVLTPLTEDRDALIERATQLRLDLSAPETDDAAADPARDSNPHH